MNYFNLHTHSHYCDGKAEPRAYVEKAIRLGFHTLGFSSHAPVPFENSFAIRDERALERYFDEIFLLKKEYQNKIRILLSLEVDYVPGITGELSIYREQGKTDYLIGGVHLVRNREKNAPGLWFIDGPYQEKYDNGLQDVFGGHPRKGVEAYYNQVIEMAVTQQPDIIAHLDKIKMHNKERHFSEEEQWYRDMVWKTLNAIARQTRSIVEVNTRGVYKKRSESLFPGPQVLEQVHHLGIPVTLSTDAHEPGELDGYYPEALAILKDIGFTELVCFKGPKRVRIPIP